MPLVRVLAVLLTLGLFGALNYFLYRRMVHDVTDSVRLRRLAAALIIALFAMLPLSRLFSVGPVTQLAAVTLTSWWGLCLFTLLALTVVEVARAASRLRPRRNADQAPPAAPESKARDLGRLAALVPSPDGAPLFAASAEIDVTFDGSEARPVQAATEPRHLATTEAPEALSRRRFVARATAAGALAFGGGLSGFGLWRAYSPPEVTEIALRLRGLPRALEGFTLVQISDLHIGVVLQERFVDQLVSIVNAAKPDLVAITGDLVDGSPSELGRHVARLSNLRARHGTAFVSGNHDYYSGWERWAPQLERGGFTVLRNRFVTIGAPGASFDLVGVDDWGSRFTRHGYDLDRATAGRDPERPSVLLAHQPSGLELAAAKHIGLQLSGHTHGGQLFPGTLVGEVVWGERNAGLCQHQGTYLYTNRGCGFVGPPMRVGAPPEVAKITLLPG